MIVYIGILAVLIVLSFVEVLYNDKRIIFISGTILALFAGLRFNLGYDFFSYERYYYEANSLSQVFDGSVRLERGYLFLSTLFSSLGFNYYTFVLFFSFLSLGLLIMFMYKHAPFPTMVLTYYFARFFMARDMGQVRGAIAAIILLYALPYIQKKQIIKFLIIVFIASLFHISSFLFIAAYLIHMVIKEVTLKNGIFLIGLATFVGWLMKNPMLYVWTVPDGYHAYFTSPSYTSGAWLLYPVLWMQLALLLGSLIFIKLSKNKEGEWIKLLTKIYLVSCLVLLAAGPLETVGGRGSTMFASVEILLVPYFFMNFTKYKLLNLLFYSGFVLVIFILIFILSGMYHQYIPYETLFG